jgi:acetyl-CoA C-acetyltransferase
MIFFLFIRNETQVPVKLVLKKEEKLMSEDEFPRPETTLESLVKLKPCFVSQAEGGTITAGNASGINDGAALLMLASLDEARLRNLKPLVRIASWSQCGCEPMLMGVAPIQAIQLAVRSIIKN